MSCLAWNPKNWDLLATGSGDGTARLWDFHGGTADGRALVMGKKPLAIHHKSIESNKKNVSAVCWHPDGTVVATGECNLLRHADDLLPASQDGVGRLFTPSGQLHGIMSCGRGAINALKFSPSGSSILTAKDDFTVCLWIVNNTYQQTMARCFDSHTKEVNDVDWFDDHVFASAGNDHTIFVFRANESGPATGSRVIPTTSHGSSGLRPAGPIGCWRACRTMGTAWYGSCRCTRTIGERTLARRVLSSHQRRSIPRRKTTTTSTSQTTIISTGPTRHWTSTTA